MPEVRDQIRSFIIKEILKGCSEDDLPDDLDLRESGVLTSLTTMQLVSFVEDEFGIDVALPPAALHDRVPPDAIREGPAGAQSWAVMPRETSSCKRSTEWGG
ncbi:phosphopantetheine-binding protein [Streptomyces cyaneofuscatus]|uniref:phosphopantetheine-binding protein n=1 Tax=Streptomyces cyaneofuscatus TaxID=66883 RepID=UPI00380FA1FE